MLGVLAADLVRLASQDTVGVHTLLWITSAGFVASVLALLAVPDIWRSRSREMRATVT